MNKKLILGIGSIVLGILLFIIFNTNIFNEKENYILKLRINGDEIKGDKVILNSGNDNMFPINLILSKLDITYNYDNNQFDFIFEDKKIVLNINSDLAIRGSKKFKLKKKSFFKNNNFYVSLDFLTDCLLFDYDYDDKLKTVFLKSKNELLLSFREALSIFSEDKYAIVTDIDTNISYKVKRVIGGFNTLADVEPVTKEDTKKMFETAGFEWNLKRRAVIVEVEGKKIAASIAPFPHSGRDDKPFLSIVDNRNGSTGKGPNLNSIRDNNMVGVVDIYFYNSMIPGVNRMDERHQEMVLKASKFKEK